MGFDIRGACTGAQATELIFDKKLADDGFA